MKEKVIDLGDLIIELANKIAGLPDKHSEKEQLLLANQLRSSAAVIALGLDIIKTNADQERQEFTRPIKRVETSLLELINNLKIALIREYINKNDYHEACILIERLHGELTTLKKSFRSDTPL